MKELQDLAQKMLADGTVGVVLGWEEGPHGARPVVVTKAEDAAKLIFDPRCVHNLASYLSPRRNHLRHLGRPAVVVKACDARAVAALIRESQLKREDAVLIGVRCGGVLAAPAAGAPLSAATMAARCWECPDRMPHLVDHLVGPEPMAMPAADGARRDRVREIEAMSAAERWAFWTGEFERCVRCNACREVCPLCFCERCVADKTVPQWIESSPHPRGNLAWHLTRAMHMAGRCVACGECERACPADIPLNLIGRKIAEVVAARYGYHVTDDPSQPAPVGAWRMDDPQEFIR